MSKAPAQRPSRSYHAAYQLSGHLLGNHPGKVEESFLPAFEHMDTTQDSAPQSPETNEPLATPGLVPDNSPSSPTQPVSPDVSISKEFKGCLYWIGGIIAVLVVLTILINWWREILLVMGFAGAWALVTFTGIRMKKNKAASIGAGFAAGLLCFFILDSFIYNHKITKKDLENPPVAIEKLAKLALPGVTFERLEVSSMGADGKGYFLNISYRANESISDESTYRSVRMTMENAYRTILSYGELPVVTLRIEAQLELRDGYGNKAWSEVYRTRLEEPAIAKLNRKNLDSVDFSNIWDVVYVHPIFREFENR